MFWRFGGVGGDLRFGFKSSFFSCKYIIRAFELTVGVFKLRSCTSEGMGLVGRLGGTVT